MQDKTKSTRHNWRTPAGLTLVALGAPLAAVSPAAAQDGQGAQAPPPANGNAQAEAQPSVAPAPESGAASDTQAAPQGPPSASGGSGSQAGAQADVEAEAGNTMSGGQAHVAADTGAQPEAGATVDESGAQSVEAGSGAAPQDGPTNAGNVKAGGWTEVESSGETNVESRGEAERDDHSVVPRRGGAEGAGFTDVDVNMREDGRRGSRATAHVKASRKLEDAIRTEACAAARDEVGKRFASHEARARPRIATETAGRREDRRRAGADESAAALRMLGIAWEKGGPEWTNALFEVCFGRRSAEQVRPEVLAPLASFEERAKIHGRVKTEAEGREHAEAEIEAREKAQVEAREQAEARARAEGELGAGGEAEAAPNVPSPSPAAPQGAPVSPGVLVPGTPVVREIAPNEQGPGVSRPVSDVTSPSGGSGQTDNAGRESAVNNTSAAQARELPFTGYPLPLALVFGAGALAAGIALRRRTRAAPR